MDIKWEMIWNYREFFIRGIWMTFMFTATGYLGGLILGMFLGMGKLSKKKWVYYPCKYYVDFFRGTPLLVQILLIHFALIPTLFGSSQGPVVSGILALLLNSAAYIAEIFRAGIQSIDRGQMEAARSLGMPYKLAMKSIILPQAFRRMIPPLGNELVALLKDSSLVSVLAANDLLFAARAVAGTYNRFWEPYITAAILYLVLTFIFSKLVTFLEVRFSITYIPKRKRWYTSSNNKHTGSEMKS